MRVLNVPVLEAACARYADAESAIRKWVVLTMGAHWSNYVDVRRTFPATDPVKLKNGATATVFNVRGNTYRLITTIDYQRQIVTIWQFLTHAEYDKEKWKASLSK